VEPQQVVLIQAEVRVKALTARERAVVAAECERFIAETLKPRFLPEVRQTSFNYPIDIIIRYRSGFPENAGEEFDASFTRLDHLEGYLAEARFDVLRRRHTGQ
jgi:hypothetical protein